MLVYAWLFLVLGHILHDAHEVLAGVGYIRIGLAFLLPQDVDTVFLFFGEFLVHGVDVGLMLAVEVSLRQLGFVNFQQELGVGAGVVDFARLLVGELAAIRQVTLDLHAARVALGPGVPI